MLSSSGRSSDQHVEEPAQVFGAVVAGEAATVSSPVVGRHPMVRCAARIARTWSMVMAPSANAVAVSDGSIHSSARAVWTHHGMPRRAGDVCRQSPVVRCRRTAPRGIKDVVALACTRGFQLLGEVWTSRIVRCNWSRVHSAGSMAK